VEVKSVRRLLVNTASSVLLTAVVSVAGVSAVATAGAFELPFQHAKPKIVLVGDAVSTPTPKHIKLLPAAWIR
jgi:hypothetical protein